MPEFAFAVLGSILVEVICIGLLDSIFTFLQLVVPFLQIVSETKMTLRKLEPSYIQTSEKVRTSCKEAIHELDIAYLPGIEPRIAKADSG